MNLRCVLAQHGEATKQGSTWSVNANMSEHEWSHPSLVPCPAHLPSLSELALWYVGGVLQRGASNQLGWPLGLGT